MSRRAHRDEIPYGAKMIAVYGNATTTGNILERVWKTRVDGVRQRYWVKTGETGIQTYRARFEFYGGGRDLSRAVVMASELVPYPHRRFTTVSARDFIENPKKYARPGFWNVREVDSF